MIQRHVFSEAGLGMAVYESRPNFAESNEIGIELTLVIF